MKRRLVFAVQEIQEQGGLICDETVPGSELIEDAGAGLCAVHLEFSVGGERILVEGKVAGRWDLACSRCLAPHKADFEGALEETYPLTQELVDVWEDVRQAVILSRPERSLCSPGCLGLCAKCGKDLNAGPCDCKSAL